MHAKVGMIEIRRVGQRGGFIGVGPRVLGPSAHRESGGLAVDKLGHAELARYPGLVGPTPKVIISLDALKHAPALPLEISSRLNVVSL